MTHAWRLLHTQVRLTSVLGDVVTDTVPTTGPYGAATGAAQFPLHLDLPTVGDGRVPTPHYQPKQAPLTQVPVHYWKEYPVPGCQVGTTCPILDDKQEQLVFYWFQWRFRLHAQLRPVFLERIHAVAFLGPHHIHVSMVSEQFDMYPAAIIAAAKLWWCWQTV
jgi:hypothetical protein